MREDREEGPEAQGVHAALKDEVRLIEAPALECAHRFVDEAEDDEPGRDQDEAPRGREENHQRPAPREESDNTR